MIKLAKHFLVTVLLTLTFVVALAPAYAGAQDSAKHALRCGVNVAANETGCGDSGESTKTINNIVTRILNIISVVIGLVAVVMIMIAGLNYITSGGDSNKVGNAKNALLYALIGLLIVAFAQVLVKFVLAEATRPPAGTCVDGKIEGGKDNGKAC